MVFLFKIGFDKLLSIIVYESYVDGWVNCKQFEKVLVFFSKNVDVRNFYLVMVLKFWYLDFDKIVVIYNENYVDKIVVFYI